MNLKNLPIILGAFVLAAGALAGIYLSTQKSSLTVLSQAGKTSGAIFYTWPAEIHVAADEETAVDIILTTQEKAATAAKVQVKYDPKVLKLKSIDRGFIFNKYLDKNIDQTVGEAVVEASGSFNGTGTFATLNFVPLKTGQSTLQIIQASSQVLDEGRTDILSGVNGGILVVE